MEQRISLITWRLRQLMTDRKIAVGDLAKELGISRTALTNLRGDKMPRISGERINQIIVALNCLIPAEEDPIGAADLLGFGLTVEEIKYVRQRQRQLKLEKSKQDSKKRGKSL